MTVSATSSCAHQTKARQRFVVSSAITAQAFTEESPIWVSDVSS